MKGAVNTLSYLPYKADMSGKCVIKTEIGPRCIQIIHALVSCTILAQLYLDIKLVNRYCQNTLNIENDAE